MCLFTCQTCKTTINQRETTTHVCVPRADDAVTDAEVLAALNADYALRYGPSSRPADSLEPYGDEHAQIMRAALSAARATRRDEEKR